MRLQPGVRTSASRRATDTLPEIRPPIYIPAGSSGGSTVPKGAAAEAAEGRWKLPKLDVGGMAVFSQNPVAWPEQEWIRERDRPSVVSKIRLPRRSLSDTSLPQTSRRSPLPFLPVLPRLPSGARPLRRRQLRLSPDLELPTRSPRLIRTISSKIHLPRRTRSRLVDLPAIPHYRSLPGDLPFLPSSASGTRPLRRRQRRPSPDFAEPQDDRNPLVDAGFLAWNVWAQWATRGMVIGLK